MPPSSTSMGDVGLLSQPPSRPTSAAQGDDDGARAMSAMSSDDGPDAQSTDFGVENTKNNAIGDDFFKKPVENISLEEVGCPAAMASPGAARAARPDPMSWVTLLFDYSQATTMHGLPYITASSRFAARRSAVCQLLFNRKSRPLLRHDECIIGGLVAHSLALSAARCQQCRQRRAHRRSPGAGIPWAIKRRLTAAAAGFGLT